MNVGLAGVLLAALGTLSWTGSAISQRQAFREPGVTAAHTVLFSSAVNTICLWALVSVLALWGPLPPAKPYGLLYFLLGGLAGTIMGRLFLATSISKVGASRTSTTKISGPVVSLIVAWVFLGEVLNLVTASGIALVLAGVLLLLTEQLSLPGGPTVANGNQPGPGSGQGRAEVQVQIRPVLYLWGMGGAAWFAVGDNLRKVGLAHIPSAAFGSAFGATVAFVVTLVSLGLSGKLGSIRGLNRRAIFWLCAQGVATASAALCTFAALLRVPVAVVSTILATEPLAIILVSWLFLRRLERVTPRLVIAAGLVIAGAALITLRRV